MGGYFAIRMKSDIVYEQEYNGVRTTEKYCTKPGLFCGLIFVTDVESGEPLAFIMTACCSTYGSAPMVASA